MPGDKNEDSPTAKAEIKTRDHLTESTINMMHEWVRNNRLNSSDELKIFGTYLYQILFTGDVHSLFSKTCDMIENRGSNSLLRVVLEFEDGSKDLITYPWEYIYYPGDKMGFFIGSKSTLILSRHVRRNMIRPDLMSDTIRLLVVTSSPRDLDRITWEPVVEAIQELKTDFPERLSIEHLEDPTPRSFRKKMETLQPHILHFIGHGSYNRDTSHGEIALVREDGEDKVAEWMEDSAFVDIFEDFPPQKFPPQIVFLQACEGATTETVERFKGLALSLVYSKVAAVVAMQYKIENLASRIFAKKFYESLAKGNYIDQAVQDGRLSLKKIWREEHLNCRIFGTPVAYTRFMDSIVMIPDKVLIGEDKEKVGDSTKSLRCPECQKNTPVGPESRYCVWCGFDLALITKCSNCGNIISKLHLHCPRCNNVYVELQKNTDVISKDIEKERNKELRNV
jgi:hypothetical protein